jgi:signal transduction histidine kinase
MPSQWPAVGAETDPLTRARQLQKSWERLLADGALVPELPPGTTAGLRPTIVESWRRSLATGLDPTDLLAPIEADEAEVLERWSEHPLGSLTDVLTEQLRKVAEESQSIVVVTDASGLVLHTVGDEWLKERAAEMNLVEGARYSEAADGTNGIGTALAADRPFQVFAFEHFNERHHQWICSGAPVHDPVSGQTVGLIDLSSLWTVAHPRSLELVTTAARTIERGLMDARRDRDARLRRRYSDFMTRRTDLLVDRDGYVLDGAERAHPSPLDIPEGGGEVVLRDGSVAEAAPLGQGEAYLLRQGTARRAESAPRVEWFGRAEERARELATEQAALRQVATLVARESSPDQLFAAVAEQVARLFDVPHVRLVRSEPEGSVVVGGFSEGDHEPFPIGSRWPLDSPGVFATVRQTARPARVEDYAHVTGEIAAVIRGAGMRSAVASPIVVERRLWGVMVVLSPRREPFPADTEARLEDFTELVATAIANAESREALALLAAEQAALRRVATLVALGTEPVKVFRAVCNETQALLGADRAGILRFHDDRTVTVMASSGGPGQHKVGTRVAFDHGFVVDWVHETHQAARFDTDDPAGADMPEVVRMTGVRSAVGSPIVVDGELWGVITLASVDSLPLAMERRLADFTELLATAIANAENKSELSASRRRIVAASDEARRRIERDLHDGTQQRLVSLGLAVRAAEANLPPERDDLRAELSSVASGLAAAVEDLQEISRGIHPAILSKGGLGPALQALAHRSAIPVDLDVTIGVRLEEPIEAAAYFVVSEALANAAKHSQASRVEVSLEQRERDLLLSVRDDGVGGADTAGGSGLVGLMDRVEALGGSIRVYSRPGTGTQITAELPLDLDSPQPVG